MNAAEPFCNQPWTTIYVQWDGKVTRPCIRGPQNLGSLETVDDIADFWNGSSFRAIRDQIRDAAGLAPPCSACHVERSRTIDHIGPFSDNISGFSPAKSHNYELARADFRGGQRFVASKPTVVIMDLSAKCHIRCLKCFVYNSDMQYGLGHMKMETFQKIVPLFETCLLVVGHENGESMLNKNFIEMVTVIKENGCRFTFNTTGQLMTPDKSDALVELGVEQIMFSIDSFSAETYEKLHKGASFQKLQTNLNYLASKKRASNSMLPLQGWYFVASRSNIHELPDIVRKADELGFSSIFVSHLNAPTSEQWGTYSDFYAAESLLDCVESKDLLRSKVDEARLIASEANIAFSTGYFG